MNDRILGALQRVGIQDSPVASLDHDQQFFALTAQTLLYQGGDNGPLHQVKLREISRIHSDHQGTLRVEAPSGTAITASLLGFDPNRVQRFFQTVRDTTARAKQLPASPLPTAPSEGTKTFAAPAALNLTPTNPAPTSPAPINAVPGPAAAPAPAPINPAPPIVIGDAPETPRVVKIGVPPPGPAALTRPELSKSEPVRAEPVRTEPVRIEPGTPVSVSPSATFNLPRTAETPKVGTPAPSTPPTRLPVSTPVKPAGPASSPVTPGPVSSPAAASQTPNPAAPPAPTTALERSLQSSSLVRSAQTVGGLSLTVRILSVVLILGALGMGYFLWRQGNASQIPALWTVTMGIVTAVALNVLAEVLKLLAALGQTVASSKE